MDSKRRKMNATHETTTDTHSIPLRKDAMRSTHNEQIKREKHPHQGHSKKGGYKQHAHNQKQDKIFRRSEKRDQEQGQNRSNSPRSQLPMYVSMDKYEAYASSDFFKLNANFETTFQNSFKNTVTSLHRTCRFHGKNIHPNAAQIKSAEFGHKVENFIHQVVNSFFERFDNYLSHQQSNINSSIFPTRIVEKLVYANENVANNSLFWSPVPQHIVTHSYSQNAFDMSSSVLEKATDISMEYKNDPDLDWKDYIFNIFKHERHSIYIILEFVCLFNIISPMEKQLHELGMVQNVPCFDFEKADSSQVFSLPLHNAFSHFLFLSKSSKPASSDPSLSLLDGLLKTVNDSILSLLKSILPFLHPYAALTAISSVVFMVSNTPTPSLATAVLLNRPTQDEIDCPERPLAPPQHTLSTSISTPSISTSTSSSMFSLTNFSMFLAKILSNGYTSQKTSPPLPHVHLQNVLEDCQAHALPKTLSKLLNTMMSSSSGEADCRRLRGQGEGEETPSTCSSSYLDVFCEMFLANTLNKEKSSFLAISHNTFQFLSSHPFSCHTYSFEIMTSAPIAQFAVQFGFFCFQFFYWVSNLEASPKMAQFYANFNQSQVSETAVPTIPQDISQHTLGTFYQQYSQQNNWNSISPLDIICSLYEDNIIAVSSPRSLCLKDTTISTQNTMGDSHKLAQFGDDDDGGDDTDTSQSIKLFVILRRGICLYLEGPALERQASVVKENLAKYAENPIVKEASDSLMSNPFRNCPRELRDGALHHITLFHPSMIPRCQAISSKNSSEINDKLRSKEFSYRRDLYAKLPSITDKNLQYMGIGGLQMEQKEVHSAAIYLLYNWKDMQRILKQYGISPVHLHSTITFFPNDVHGVCKGSGTLLFKN